jgi:hypothetical protein
MTKKRKALEYLKRVGKATSLQIRERINTVAPAAMMADLRKLGCDVKSTRLYTTYTLFTQAEYIIDVLTSPPKK